MNIPVAISDENCVELTVEAWETLWVNDLAGLGTAPISLIPDPPDSDLWSLRDVAGLLGVVSLVWILGGREGMLCMSPVDCGLVCGLAAFIAARTAAAAAAAAAFWLPAGEDTPWKQLDR